MKLLGLLQLLLFLLFLPLTSPHCLFNASITIPPSTATICLPLPHVETTIINLCTVTSTPLLNCLATIAPPLETLPTRETPPHELYPLTITAPQSHTITQYATNQRLYFTLSLSNYTTTTRNACIHLDLNENTVWCGHVSSEGHETLYLTQRDTKMLGEGLHVAKVVVDSSSDGGVTFGTVFEMVQPRIEITSVADDVVHVNVEGFDVAKNSRWRTCLIVNDIPRCAPAANFTPKNFTLPGFTGGHVTPMILDEVCGKVLWMGREVRVYGEPSEPEPHELACLLCDLRSVEYGLYSQNGEDGVILYLLTHVIKHDYRGTPVTYFEFGAESGVEVNTRLLRERFNATGVLMDGGYEDPRIGLHKEFITQENVRMLKEKYHVADDVDVLSVDLDRNDWWILKALMEGGIQVRRGEREREGVWGKRDRTEAASEARAGNELRENCCNSAAAHAICDWGGVFELC